ncbi:putative metal-binding motif-containing protein [Corallococcus aberystwythensis]|uniref:putative metal-binding motif-containing protein n=1 Tax=Corallococcus aberystwythensis TaxID=2316722 RepID=UPI00131575BB|nr:putative metal-binding motif-containing protein [Corallococcus aberystwythensis]
MTLTVTDQTEVSRSVTTNVNVKPDPAPGTLSVAVFRQAGWSNDVRLLATAQERSCEGAQVATAETNASLEKNGVTTVDLSLGATDGDGDGFVSPANGGTDCADDNEDRGGPTAWYTDADGDKYGSRFLDPVLACSAPSFNTTSRAGDCDDNDSSINPGVQESRCDRRDDNCNGEVDEAFDLGGACVNASNCPGAKICSNGVAVCNSTVTPTAYYLDEDGDGKAGTLGGTTCEPPPLNSKPEAEDCDESSRYRASGTPEVCDRIDNDCADGADDGLTCNATWKPFTTPDSTSWKTIATDGSGGIWAAGDGGNLARGRMDGTGGKSVTCDGDWKAAWASSSGEVFLAGGKDSSSRFAQAAATANTCTLESNTNGQVLNGLVGIVSATGGSLTLYGVTGGGQTFRWAPPAAPERIETATADASLRAISGVGGPETLLAVGSKSEGFVPTLKPRAFRFDVASSTWVKEELPATLVGELRGVHVVNANYAFAVGDNGIVLERVKGKWSEMKTLPAAFASRSIQDVVAFGKTAVYVATTEGVGAGGAVLFFNGSDWITVHTDARSPARSLRSLDAKAPTGIVTVGDSGAGASFIVTP